MTTLRKKREFKKSLKKENNKASKKKLRKRSKNKISKRRLVAGARARSIEYLRNVSGTREPRDIKDVFQDIGNRFVQEYNGFSVENPRISKRDASVYLNIQFNNNSGKDLFHISDHPGDSQSDCGAIHIKQLHTFSGHEIGRLIIKNGKQEPEGRCFKIIKHPTELNKLSLYSYNNTNNEDFLKLKLLIENITEQEVIDLGLYTRLDNDFSDTIRHINFSYGV